MFTRVITITLLVITISTLKVRQTILMLTTHKLMLSSQNYTLIEMCLMNSLMPWPFLWFHNYSPHNLSLMIIKITTQLLTRNEISITVAMLSRFVHRIQCRVWRLINYAIYAWTRAVDEYRMFDQHCSRLQNAVSANLIKTTASMQQVCYPCSKTIVRKKIILILSTASTTTTTTITMIIVISAPVKVKYNNNFSNNSMVSIISRYLLQ